MSTAAMRDYLSHILKLSNRNQLAPGQLSEAISAGRRFYTTAFLRPTPAPGIDSLAALLVRLEASV